jgi:hypothetical protein
MAIINVSGDITKHWTMHIRVILSKQAIVYYVCCFEDEHDAMMFKLRWA